MKRDGAYFVRVGPGMIEWNPSKSEALLFMISALAARVADMTGGKVKSVYRMVKP